MKKLLLLLFVFCFYFSSNSFAQDTSIPDSNFEEFLIRLNIDDVLDGKVETINISGIPRLDILGNSPQSPGKIEDLTGIEDFVSLQILNCNDNSITSIDVSGATVLRQLNCYNNELTSLDVTNNTALELLVCYGNELASLDLSQNPLLTTLNCQDNPPLSCIEVGNETAANAGDPPYTTWMKPATAVYSEDCQSLIPKTYVPDDAFEQALIDLGYDAGLDDYVYTFEIDDVTTLDIAGSDIDVGDIQDLTGIEAFASLNELYCSYNQITDLNLSQNKLLTVLECDNNELTSLNVRNGNNFLLTSFNASNNPSLFCIQVDDEIKANTGVEEYENWEKEVKAAYSNDCSLLGIEYEVPDLIFEKALEKLRYDYGDPDGKLKASLISAVTSLDVHYEGISDLTGIEGFTSLVSLNCGANSLSKLDVSENTNLEVLICSGNRLTGDSITLNTGLKSLNCSNNPMNNLNMTEGHDLSILKCENNELTSLPENVRNTIESLNCRHNLIEELDFSANDDLVGLDCNDNKLTELILTENYKLKELDCGSNKLTSLVIGTKNELTVLDCRNNQLESLIVSGAEYLNNLDCHGNNLTSLDLSANTGLWRLLCYDNKLEILDLSANDEMKSLYCNKNYLTSLNVQNGNNVEFLEFNALNNPSLFCIQVDDADKANAGETPYRNWVTDDRATYSQDCSQPITVTVSDVFEQLLVDLNIDSDGEVNGEVSTSDIYGLTELNIPSEFNPGSLDDIGILINLETLIVHDINLTNLDLSNNPALKYLDCSNSGITSLDLSDNLLLEYIDVSNNPLTPGPLILPTTYSPYSEAPEHLKSKNSSLANITLLYLNIANTDLTSIDVSDFESLDTLNVSGSKLDSLDVSANVSLRYLNTTSTPLTCIQVNQDQLANIPAGWEKEATASYAVDCQAASGIEDELLAASIRMYPNPVNDVLTVESDFRLTKVEVYSIVGGKVKEIITDFSTIQTGHLSKGIYILKIHSEKGIATKKFTKE